MTPTTILTCFSKGERWKYAGREVRLNRVSNSQPPDHEPDTLTTEQRHYYWQGNRVLELMRCHYTEKSDFRIVLHQYFQCFDSSAYKPYKPKIRKIRRFAELDSTENSVLSYIHIFAFI